MVLVIDKFVHRSDECGVTLLRLGTRIIEVEYKMRYKEVGPKA